MHPTPPLRSNCIVFFLWQGYLKEFNGLFEELQGKKVGVFGVCAEPQKLVDQTMKDWGLKFTVSRLKKLGSGRDRGGGGEGHVDSKWEEGLHNYLRSEKVDLW